MEKERIIDFISLVDGDFDRFYPEYISENRQVIKTKIPPTQFLVCLKMGYLTKERAWTEPEKFLEDVLKMVQDAYDVLKTYGGSEIKKK